MNDDRVIKGNHDFDENGLCQSCGWTNISSKAVRDLDNLTLQDEVAPKGFSNVYRYTGETGGGATVFFNDTAFGGYDKFKFAMLSEPGKQIGLIDLTTWAQHRLPLAENEAKWVGITVEKNSNNVWTITSDNGDFCTMSGTAESSSYSLTVTGVQIRNIFAPIGGGNTPFTITEILAGFKSDNHKHNVVSGMCTVCNKYILDYSTYVTKQNCLSETTFDAPKNFSKVYYYSEAVGGGADNCFFKHQYINISVYTSFEFAVWNQDGNARIQDTIGYAQTNLSSYDVSGAFTKVVLNRKDASTWDLVINDKETNVTTKNAESLFAMFRLLTNGSFYITETLYTK